MASARGRTADLVVPLGVGLVATAGLLALGIATDQANWQVYLVVLVLGAAAGAVLHRRAGLSRLTIWGLLLFGLGHLAGGMVPAGSGTLYQLWLVQDLVRYDNLQHAVGFGFVGRTTWEVLGRRLSPAPADRPVVAWWVVVLGAGAFGAANEIVEYVPVTTPTANVTISSWSARSPSTRAAGPGRSATARTCDAVSGSARSIHRRGSPSRTGAS